MQNISRRSMLKTATGATMALPFLESFHLSAAERESRNCVVAIQIPLGIYANALYPDDLSVNSLDTEYLRPFAKYHDRMSLVSGLYHPGVSNGHVSSSRIFTGTPNMTTGDPKTAPNGESFDQTAARHLGHKTRFSSLTLATGDRGGLSWHNNGMAVPSIRDMSALFDKLFKADSVSDLDSHRQRLKMKNSVLDAIFDHSKTIEPSLTQTDRDKLGEYFHAVREAEKGIMKEKEWLETPKPVVDADAYPDEQNNRGFTTQVRNVLDMVYLSLATDSTRIVTTSLFAQGNTGIDGVNNGYHGLSHHGKDPENIRQLKIIEHFVLGEILRLVDRLDAAKEPDGRSLLDHTTVVVTSNLGNGSNHSSRNMPLVMIGGGLNHGNHINFTPANETPMCNVYLTVLQKMGVPVDSFSTSTGVVGSLV